MCVYVYVHVHSYIYICTYTHIQCWSFVVPGQDMRLRPWRPQLAVSKRQPAVSAVKHVRLDWILSTCAQLGNRDIDIDIDVECGILSLPGPQKYVK